MKHVKKAKVVEEDTNDEFTETVESPKLKKDHKKDLELKKNKTSKSRSLSVAKKVDVSAFLTPIAKSEILGKFFGISSIAL